MMNIRSVTVIMVIALALICSLFIQAQINSSETIDNLTYEGTDPDNDTMSLSWDAIADTASATVQAKGGGIVDSWTSVDGLSISSEDGTTVATFNDLSTYQVSGTTFNFRAQVKLEDNSSTPWAYVNQS